MIDHIGFPVSDYERAKAFYVKALAPLGYRVVMEVTMVRPASARIITPIITAPSSSTPTATTSKRCATRRREAKLRRMKRDAQKGTLPPQRR
jgi:hypothetical protein